MQFPISIAGNPEEDDLLTYHRPASLQEACALLAGLPENVAFDERRNLVNRSIRSRRSRFAG